MAADTSFTIRPIGYVRSTRTEAIDDDWDAERATIELVEPFGADALAQLDAFSHVEVLFVFDQVDEGSVHTGSRVPRNNPAWPAVGIFAQRAKNRPNRLGLTTARIVGVDGATLEVAGLDAIDGTPVVDLKPVMAEFGPRGEHRQPAWSSELMAGYW